MASSSSPRLASYSCERRPLLLKDFLTDDSAPSCSSNGRFMNSFHKNSSNTQLLRSRSKATSISISAIHKASEMVINAIKFLPFASMVKSHSILPRSISRKLSRSRDHKDSKLTPVVPGAEEVSVATPKIKDILRWKSFRDVVEELSTSWYERDFTAEDLPSWGGENTEFMDHNRKKMEGQFSIDENELHSPVSVLDNPPFCEDGGFVSFFNRSIDTMERRKCILMQRIEEFESLAKLETFDLEEGLATEEDSIAEELDEESNAVEAKARELLSQVKATASSAKRFEADENHLLLDFFRHELAITTSKRQEDAEPAGYELLRLAKSWISREQCDGTFDWEKAEASLRDVENGLRWDKFDEEQQELGRELEIHVLNYLLDELLSDLVIQLSSGKQF
ncbi:uncharacterized protein LOC113763597 [Coffea eugenioides]|uniref:uncharacterized protein LOC113763597 n=1 Tax=Coffea eugenioides TaxID=49369 RepID=UPI000F614AB6|nr:uncharacterized protein LOC113763597 [Coffea eugenioides]